MIWSLYITLILFHWCQQLSSKVKTPIVLLFETRALQLEKPRSRADGTSLVGRCHVSNPGLNPSWT